MSAKECQELGTSIEVLTVEAEPRQPAFSLCILVSLRTCYICESHALSML